MNHTIENENYKDQQPGIQQPETQQPETQQPETQQPETQQPETQQPETQQPETQQLETQKPETQQPETQQPETQQPETQTQTEELQVQHCQQYKLSEDQVNRYPVILSQRTAYFHNISVNDEMEESIYLDTLIDDIETKCGTDNFDRTINQEKLFVNLVEEFFRCRSAASEEILENFEAYIQFKILEHYSYIGQLASSCTVSNSCAPWIDLADYST
jgi:hypothetical protein